MIRPRSVLETGVFLLLSMLIAGAAAARAADSDWPQWRGPARDGVAPAGPNLVTQWQSDGPPVLWEIKNIPSGGDGGYASPVVAGERVFLFVNHHYAVPIATRTISEESLRNLGWQKEMPPKEVLDSLEKARTGDERRELKDGQKINDWSQAWVKSNLPGEKESKQYGNFVRDRLRRGPDAVSLDVFDKMLSVKDKPFATAADFDAWLDAQQITGDARKQVLGVVPKDVRKVDDEVFCWSLKNGDVVWQRKWPGNGDTSSTLTLAGGKCFGLSSTGEAFCLNASDGADVWRVKAHPGHSSFLVDDGRAVILNDELTALDANSGSLVWKQPKVKGNESSPVAWKPSGAESSTYLLCNSNQGLACVASADGDVKWTVPGGSPSTVALSGDIAVVLTDKADLGLVAYRITPQAATKLWNVAKVTERGSSPIIAGGHVYAIAGDRTLCVKLDSGEVKWEGKPGHGDISSPLMADGKIIAALQGRLALINASPERYELLAKFRENPASCASAAIVNGKLVLRTSESVKCYNLSQGEAVEAAAADKKER